MSVMSVFAAELAAAGGALARRRFYSERYRVGKKDDGETITDADHEVEELIASRIAEKYPEHGFWGEERGKVGDSRRCWVVDPIDGTTNFVHRYEYCAVSVAYCENGRALAGAVHNIAANETFHAARGEGAFLHNQRLRVSPRKSFSDSLFLAGGVLDAQMWEVIRDLATRTAGMRRCGATALDLAIVAAGRADMLVSGPVRYWDVAAGALLVREAGGLLADSADGTTFAFAEPTKCFVAGAAGVFAPYLATLKKSAE